MDSPWFIHVAVPIASAGMGLPLSIAWLFEAGSDPGRIAIAVAPFLGCGLIGYLLFGLIRWGAALGEAQDAE